MESRGRIDQGGCVNAAHSSVKLDEALRLIETEPLLQPSI
jgi:hypothetical protein